MQKYFDNVTNANGVAQPGATVAVTLTSSGAAATIYSDNGVSQRSNQITADANGYYEFYAPNGRYTLTFSGLHITTFSITDVQIQDAEASAISAASNAALATAGASTSQAAATQSALLAGVTGVYGTNAAMQTAIASIAANANVEVLADEVRQGQASIYQKVSGTMTYLGTVRWNAGTSNGLGDIDPEGLLQIWCGDSTFEQMGGSNFGFDSITNEYRIANGPLERLTGIINMGGSGFKLSAFITGALAALPTYSTSNLGVSNNDYYGHKSAGSFSLATAMAWRGANVDGTKRVLWVIGHGINDCILDNTVGNLSQQGISDYVSGYLRQAIRSIQSGFPSDKIMLAVPHWFTARPWTGTYPTPAQYPAFGSDLPTDQALVEKWNQGIRNGYLQVRQDFPGVRVQDLWSVFGRSDTTKVAGTDLTYMTDMVHMNGAGNNARLYHAMKLFAPSAKLRVQPGRNDIIERRATAAAINPWEFDGKYLNDNPKYVLAWEGVLQTKNAAFLDLTGVPGDWFQAIRGRDVYLQVGDGPGQKFTGSTIAVTLNTTTVRLSVTPSAAVLAMPTLAPVRVFIDAMWVLPYTSTIDHITGGRAFVRVPEKFPNGGTLSADTGTPPGSNATIDCFKIAGSTRTSLGTITVLAGQRTATLATGNPTSIAVGDTFEFKITSATVANLMMQGIVTPS